MPKAISHIHNILWCLDWTELTDPPRPSFCFSCRLINQRGVGGRFTEKQNKLREFHLVISELNSPYGSQYLADSGHLISSYWVKGRATHIKLTEHNLRRKILPLESVLGRYDLMLLLFRREDMGKWNPHSQEKEEYLIRN